MNTLDYYLIQTYFPGGAPVLNDYTKVFVYRRGAIVFEGSFQEYLADFVPSWNSAEFAVVHDTMPDTEAYEIANQAYLDKVAELEAALIADLYETRTGNGYNVFVRCFQFAEEMVAETRTIDTTPRTEEQYLALFIEKLDDVLALIAECVSDIRVNLPAIADDTTPPLPELQGQTEIETP